MEEKDQMTQTAQRYIQHVQHGEKVVRKVRLNMLANFFVRKEANRRECAENGGYRQCWKLGRRLT